ncbi:BRASSINOSTEROID INSENSITIVE 1-associated receptor kinase 1 precursor, putative [Ricinus communis]|uniref:BRASSINOSTEROID INSENSITIVE 1-associated receptor kinase 1, putative n=1 Tax=Ricinus communis TaxID=3988 RepID=B9RAQ8_RICCO|nr:BRASSINOSTEROID INSENSITIVE 1-associated receptor kinase 1 precursor, putative [Ricinus communis]|eukprot:XP_002511283.1 leucine-rich repeat receptor-like serine/threonine/tyrosine-protein kinase SOBIR1 [Ricinus communis]
MAFTPHSPFLSILILLSVVSLTSARVNLDNIDLNAFSVIHRDLGINSQRIPSATPCDNSAVFCERRLSKNNTYILKISRLIFKSQRLDGFLSPAIGRLSELKELSVPNNQLVDQLPSQIVDCKKLEILDLGNNEFSGQIPSELSKLLRLRVLDLSNNKFFGNLSFLKQFPNLEHLNLANNLFSGTVPKSIRSFRNLQFFDFSGNGFLEGRMPLMSKAEASGSQYPKRYVLAESSNKSTTAINKNVTSVEGPTSAQAPSPSTGNAPHKKKSGKRKLSGWILGFLAGAVAGSMSGFVFSVMFKLILATIRGGGKDSGPAIFSPHLIKKAENLAFLEKEDGLSNLELIGRGGCGEVYKAELPGSNGKMIAIKKIVQPPRDAAELTEEDTKLLNKKMRQIRSEINTVGQIRHRNLLPLLAHVSRPDCHCLVYEFMKNGSLQDILSDVEQGKRELDWLARHRIAIGVASGLEYLHTSHSPRIIHRDLKPANVLLDDDMEARIADFGLAKAMPDANTHVTTSNVAGTVGYIAPEYHQTLKFTDKCDIYSFGVLLGVLVMGKLPSDEFFQTTREMSLVKWMRNIMTSENPSQAIDPKMNGNGFEEQMLLVLKIACFCTLDDPRQRPNSKDIRCMLSQIKH